MVKSAASAGHSGPPHRFAGQASSLRPAAGHFDDKEKNGIRKTYIAAEDIRGDIFGARWREYALSLIKIFAVKINICS